MGTALVNVIPITRDDKIVSVVPVKDFSAEDKSLVFLTKYGQVKRTPLAEYSTNRQTAVAACKLSGDDEVIDVQLSANDRDLLLITKFGQSIRFDEKEVSSMGRVSGGVRGISLAEGDEVIGGLWLHEDEGEVLVFSDRGYAKRTLVADYPKQGRGGKGVATFEFKEGKRVRSNGTELVSAFVVTLPYTLTVVPDQGEPMAVFTEDIPIDERRSTGKQVIPLTKDQRIIDIIRI
jgi:topoisomerase-4 subunit A